REPSATQSRDLNDNFWDSVTEAIKSGPVNASALLNASASVERPAPLTPAVEAATGSPASPKGKGVTGQNGPVQVEIVKAIPLDLASQGPSGEHPDKQAAPVMVKPTPLPVTIKESKTATPTPPGAPAATAHPTVEPTRSQE